MTKTARAVTRARATRQRTISYTCHHKYFDKWKALNRDEFKDGEGKDAADEVVHKVARRCKIFLQPDIWPSDLNEDQKLLLQAMWDKFSESALF